MIYFASYVRLSAFIFASDDVLLFKELVTGFSKPRARFVPTADDMNLHPAYY